MGILIKSLDAGDYLESHILKMSLNISPGSPYHIIEFVAGKVAI